MTKIILRREAYGSQSGEKGADVRLGAGDVPLREAVASAAAAMERRVHVLDQSADVLPGVDDRVVIRAVRAREDGAAPSADLRRGVAHQKANADAIRLLNEAMPNDKVLALRSLEALAKVANGKATKIIIPSDLQNLGGVVPSIKELMTDPKDAE